MQGLSEQIQHIELGLLRIDFGLQLRARISEEHVEALAEAYLADEPIPPIQVVHDSKTAWVWDGNHRLLARRKAGFDTMPCIVEQGTYRDAQLKAAGANHGHGLPRSNADKRSAVMKLLEDKQWTRRSDRWIAETCKVSRTLVAAIREELQAKVQHAEVAEMPPEKRMGRDGKEYPPAAVKQPDAEDDDPWSDDHEPEYTEDDPGHEMTLVSTRDRLDDLYAAHCGNEIKLNRQEIELIQAVRSGRPLAGAMLDQALQIISLHRPCLAARHAEADDPDDSEDTAEPDRVLWVKERIGWLWDKYNAAFGGAAELLYFRMGIEAALAAMEDE